MNGTVVQTEFMVVFFGCVFLSVCVLWNVNVFLVHQVCVFTWELIHISVAT